MLIENIRGDAVSLTLKKICGGSFGFTMFAENNVSSIVTKLRQSLPVICSVAQAHAVLGKRPEAPAPTPTPTNEE